MFKPQVVLTPLEYFNSRKRKILEYLKTNYKVKLMFHYLHYSTI